MNENKVKTGFVKRAAEYGINEVTANWLFKKGFDYEAIHREGMRGVDDRVPLAALVLGGMGGIRGLLDGEKGAKGETHRLRNALTHAGTDAALGAGVGAISGYAGNAGREYFREKAGSAEDMAYQFEHHPTALQATLGGALIGGAAGGGMLASPGLMLGGTLGALHGVLDDTKDEQGKTHRFRNMLSRGALGGLGGAAVGLGGGALGGAALGGLAGYGAQKEQERMSNSISNFFTNKGQGH